MVIVFLLKYEYKIFKVGWLNQNQWEIIFLWTSEVYKQTVESPMTVTVLCDKTSRQDKSNVKKKKKKS